MAGGRGVAGDSDIEILPYDRAFDRDLVEICWRTGFLGESLEGTRRFEDRRLFAMLFALPWTRYDPEACFVAVAEADGRRRAIGYVLGTDDTRGQRRDFDRHWVPRIALRLVLWSWWRHPESARQVLRLARIQHGHDAAPGADGAPSDGTAVEDPGSMPAEPGGPAYPAHLHINLLPGWQGRRIGARLMDALLSEMRRRGVPGIFLQTSDRNTKAVPFYEGLGFRLVSSDPGGFWEGVEARGLTYALRLDRARG